MPDILELRGGCAAKGGNKLRNTIAFVLALILVSLMLCSCATDKGVLDVDEHGKRFKEVYSDSEYYIVVDMDTGVEYAVSNVLYNRGTFTMLCDRYGNPYIYPAFDAKEDKP